MSNTYKLNNSKFKIKRDPSLARKILQFLNRSTNSISISKKKIFLRSPRNNVTNILCTYNIIKLEKFQCCSNQTRPARPSRICRSHRSRRRTTSAKRKSRPSSRTSSRRTRSNPTRRSTKSGRGECCSPRRRRSSSRDVSASRNTWAHPRGSIWPRLYGWPPPRWRSGSRITGTRRRERRLRRAEAVVRPEGSLYRCWSRMGNHASRSWWSLPRIRPRARYLCRLTYRNLIGGKMDFVRWERMRIVIVVDRFVDGWDIWRIDGRVARNSRRCCRTVIGFWWTEDDWLTIVIGRTICLFIGKGREKLWTIFVGGNSYPTILAKLVYHTRQKLWKRCWRLIFVDYRYLKYLRLLEKE